MCEKNKALVRSVIEAANDNLNFDDLERLITPDFVAHNLIGDQEWEALHREEQSMMLWPKGTWW